MVPAWICPAGKEISVWICFGGEWGHGSVGLLETKLMSIDFIFKPSIHYKSKLKVDACHVVFRDILEYV